MYRWAAGAAGTASAGSEGCSSGASLKKDDRLTEDKLNAFNLECGLVHIAMHLSSVHGSRELPAYYDAWLVVEDSYLPIKGTTHRLREACPASNGQCVAVLHDLEGI